MTRQTFYAKYIKRFLDIVCSVAVIGLFWWVYLIIAILVHFKLGSPVLFKQKRPGIVKEDSGIKKETIFDMYKFRSMSNTKDKDGNLLPDEKRLTHFGKALRATSLDELPEVFNILKGDMSLIGPRPQLVRDMVFMSPEQRLRHTVRPGLSGLAQVNGRNAIDWEKKFVYDLEYIENITFVGDLKILFQTLAKVFVKQEGITQEGMATAEDYGDYLLRLGKISKAEYDTKQLEAISLLKRKEEK